MKSLLHSLPILLPIVYVWAEKQEAIFLAEGKPLTDGQVKDALHAGVVYPEKIRVTFAEHIPQPDNDDLMFIASQLGLYSDRTAGITLGYGICLRKDMAEDRHALVHECVHVSQYEKKGGLQPFLAEYLRECIDPGFPFGRLEQEAIHMAKDICRQTAGFKPAY